MLALRSVEDGGVAHSGAILRNRFDRGIDPTERFAKFTTCEVSQVKSKGHPAWTKLGQTPRKGTPVRDSGSEQVAVEKAGIDWPHNCLRHSFCSHAVALHGFTWTACKRTIQKEC
jgi:hypothetical protein